MYYVVENVNFYDTKDILLNYGDRFWDVFENKGIREGSRDWHMMVPLS